MARTISDRGGGELSTIIGSDAQIDGNLTVKNSARVDGKIKGTVESSETITVGSSGSVEGDVTAQSIIIGGKITGNIKASGRIVLESSATLTGNLKTMRLVVEEGATFNGCSEMGETKTQTHAPRQIKLSSDE